jgi:hypothetical protein
MCGTERLSKTTRPVQYYTMLQKETNIATFEEIKQDESKGLVILVLVVASSKSVHWVCGVQNRRNTSQSSVLTGWKEFNWFIDCSTLKPKQKKTDRLLSLERQLAETKAINQSSSSYIRISL